MLEMSLPWWEFVLRALVVYAVLLLLVRISGKRTVGQFTPFDLLVVMLLSEAVSESLSGGDESLVGGLIAATTLLALNTIVALLASRSRAMAEVFDGSAILIGKDGEFFDKAVKQCRLGDGDLEEALREHDCQREEMASAYLEADGAITIQKKRQSSR
jgi:uncharacterized membrane protein YcaP (DUF421 family)